MGSNMKQERERERVCVGGSQFQGQERDVWMCVIPAEEPPAENTGGSAKNEALLFVPCLDRCAPERSIVRGTLSPFNIFSTTSPSTSMLHEPTSSSGACWLIEGPFEVRGAEE